MKLYRHYKNKFYKYIATARHSEGLDDVVVYETYYDSPGGKLWVRPQSMFHEKMEIDGKVRPRFEAVSLEFRESTQISESDLTEIAFVMERAFGQWDPRWFNATFRNHSKWHLLLAFIDGGIVGFKLGYELSPQEFYSWLGGVLPDFRGLGIASELMKKQHEWCRREGYAKVQTKTQNRFREMLLLNIREGFDVIGVHDSSEGGMKIVLEKSLK